MFEQWILAHGGDLQTALFFALFAFFATVELLAPKRPGHVGRKRRWPVNLGLTAINIAAMAMIPVTFFGTAVWAQERNLGLLNRLQLPILILVIASLLGRALISFLTHYLMHKVPVLWRLHRVHHLDTEMDVSTTVRFHPLEFLASTVPGLPIALALGLAPWVLLLYEVFDAGITVFSHANISLPRALERVLRIVIVTPDLHRVHHSSRQPETDSNFGAVFPIWDMAFRTYRTETRVPQESMPLGLEEVRDDRVNSLRWLLASPLRGRVGDATEG